MKVLTIIPKIQEWQSSVKMVALWVGKLRIWWAGAVSYLPIQNQPYTVSKPLYLIWALLKQPLWHTMVNKKLGNFYAERLIINGLIINGLIFKGRYMQWLITMGPLSHVLAFLNINRIIHSFKRTAYQWW